MGANANRAILFVFDDSLATAAGRRSVFDRSRLRQFNTGCHETEIGSIRRRDFAQSHTRTQAVDCYCAFAGTMESGMLGVFCSSMHGFGSRVY
jgi:hypothetical protein